MTDSLNILFGENQQNKRHGILLNSESIGYNKRNGMCINNSTALSLLSIVINESNEINKVNKPDAIIEDENKSVQIENVEDCENREDCNEIVQTETDKNGKRSSYTDALKDVVGCKLIQHMSRESFEALMTLDDIFINDEGILRCITNIFKSK